MAGASDLGSAPPAEPENLSHGKFITAVASAPVTIERPVHDFDYGKLGNPGLPRATRAATVDHPFGSPGSRDDLTVLQKHCLFFSSSENDRVIYPWNTFAGFRSLGFNIIFCFLAMVRFPFFSLLRFHPCVSQGV
jgi:peroxygenase